MAELNLDYYGGEDLYSDGDIENEILEIVKSGSLPGEDSRASFPVLYHLSKIRENILNWYPFRESASCLEIGSGCGAITGLLCSRLSKVTSVELSKRRAQINFERHKDLDNLEIRVGNLNDMKFEGGFDYVILNGVFEYAMSFTQGEAPYEIFLSHVKSFLKPDGVLLIAIENRLGLKYFAGAPEDHTDGYFDGIRGYKGNRSVRTFSRSEWETLMRRCGLDYYRFYYPYPDYKFPKEIFTDEALQEQTYGKPAWNFNECRLALFSETEMAETLQQEGVVARFANSFLIEMSTQPLAEDCRVEYAKLGTDRAEQFSIATVIETRELESDPGTAVMTGEQENGRGQRNCRKLRVVRKSPMTPAAQLHVKEMLAQMEDRGTWRPLPGTEEKGSIIYPFLKQGSLGAEAAEAAGQRDIARLQALVRKAAQLCKGQRGIRKKGSELSPQELESFRRVFGDQNIKADADCIAPANIDLILDNIFEKDGKYQVIDCEWVFEFPVPVDFILWRVINEIYSNHPYLEQACGKQKFLEEWGITPELAGTFWNWGTYFAESYVGANRLLNRSIPETPVSLEEYRRKIWNRGHIVSGLYLDTGKGFSEKEMLVENLVLSGGEFSVTFDLKGFQNIRAMRFDPLEGSPCICQIYNERTTARLAAVNAAAREAQGDLFLTTDPIYVVKNPDKKESLTICGKITVLSMEKALNRANHLLNKSLVEKLAFWKR